MLPISGKKTEPSNTKNILYIETSLLFLEFGGLAKQDGGKFISV